MARLRMGLDKSHPIMQNNLQLVARVNGHPDGRFSPDTWTSTEDLARNQQGQTHTASIQTNVAGTVASSGSITGHTQGGKIRLHLAGGPANQSVRVAVVAEARATAMVNVSSGRVSGSAGATTTFEGTPVTASAAGGPDTGWYEDYPPVGRTVVTRDTTLDTTGAGYVDFNFSISVVSSTSSSPPPSGGGQINVVASGSVRLVQVYVAAPDPEGKPVLGQNEYTMVGPHIPFSIPCSIGVAGAVAGTMDFLKPKATWSLSRTLPYPLNTLMDDNIVSGNELAPQFHSDYGDDPFPVRMGLGFSVLNGLPPDNGAFGARDVQHKLDGSLVGTSAIEVFYASTALTHPGVGPQSCNTTAWPVPDHLFDATDDTVFRVPNWFYYYNLAYPPLCRVSYDPVGTGGRSNYFPGAPLIYDHIHVSVEGTHGHWQHRLWETRAAYGSYVVLVGIEDTYGIDTYASNMVHEYNHKLCHDATGPDSDGDGLPDDLEDANHLDKSVRDTTGFGRVYPGDYSDIADQDVFCQIQQTGVTGPRDLDWADDGLNHGTVPGPDPANRHPKTYFPTPSVPPS